MKAGLTATLFLVLVLGTGAKVCDAQGFPPVQPQAAGAPATDINAILSDLQRVAVSANGDIGSLRIERWKTSSDQKQQLQHLADSLQQNITRALPELIGDVQASPGSVSKAFNLYHNLNVLYELFSSLAESAGAFGKNEEYQSLANDAGALDAARQHLSSYIESSAASLESRLQQAIAAEAHARAAQPQEPRKIIIDNDLTPPTKKTRKPAKKSTSAHPQTTDPSH